MAILGLGTDIVEIRRITSIVDRNAEKLAQRILHPSELQCYLKNSQAVRFLAKRFAVKEAAAKALGTGMRDGIMFNQFELINDRLGKPILNLHHRALMFVKQRGMKYLHVSIADERYYACATVIIEG